MFSAKTISIKDNLIYITIETDEVLWISKSNERTHNYYDERAIPARRYYMVSRDYKLALKF